VTIQQISVFLENKAGRLAEVVRLLANQGIDLRAVSLADTSDFGILRIIVSDTEKASQVLNQAGYVSTVTPVLAVAITDEPGGMAAVAEVLAKANINVEYTYAFITRHEGTAYMICRVENNEKAVQALSEAGIRLAAQGDVSWL
jgi:hypothetical protein